MVKIYLVLLLALTITCNSFAFEDGIRIAWNYKSAKFVTTGVYARVKRIATSELALVYSDGPSVWIRKSANNGNTWNNAVLVARQTGYNYTNSELIQLSNGWLLYAWNGRSLTDGIIPYIIKTKISKDNGATWVNEQLVYTADVVFSNGCWEPAMLQIASGEIQLFFANENPYRNSDKQEISMSRSFDNGSTWSSIITTSFRAGYRDGMPVPIALQNNEGLAYCIEDNGLNGSFKPTIIWSSTADNWNQGVATAASPRRWGALRADYALASNIYAGAPYITQLPSGETILSCQSSEGRTSSNNANMCVYIGNNSAKNFSCPSIPFPWLAATGSALWNSLNIIDDSTVMAVSSITGAGADGIWIITGKVIHPIQAKNRTITVDGINSPQEWDANPEVFIGSQSSTNLNAQVKWDNNNLYILADVKDKNLWANDTITACNNDGIEVYIDPQNKSCAGICTGLYKLLFNIGSHTLFQNVNAQGAWTEWVPQGVNYKITTNGTVNNNADVDQGYLIEIAISWNQIGEKPITNTGWGIHFKLHDANGSAVVVHEDLSGDDPNKAYTWLNISLAQTAISILDINDNSSFSIFPNPTTGQLTINSDQLSVDEIKIVDVEGRVVYQSNEIFTGFKTIDVQGLQSGMYFISLKDQGVIETKKIIIRR